MDDAKQLRSAAWRSLKGKWRYAAPLCLLAAVLGGNAGFLGPTVTVELVFDYLAKKAPASAMGLMGMVGVLGALSFAYGLCAMVLGSLAKLDWCRVHLALAREKKPPTHFLNELEQVPKALLLRLMGAVQVIGGTVLLVIPGLVNYYRYTMAPYIMAQEPDCSPKEAMRRSRALMRGHKLELFYLDCSFFGWFALSAVCLWLLNPLVLPWHEAARANFYLSLEETK